MQRGCCKISHGSISTVTIKNGRKGMVRVPCKPINEAEAIFHTRNATTRGA